MPLVIAGIVLVLICFLFAFIGNLIDDFIFNFAPLLKIILVGGCFYGCYYFLKANKEVSQNNELIKVDEAMTKTNSDDKQPSIPTFNLSSLNLLELSNELKKSLNNTSSSFIWIRKRENEKLKLQKEKIEIILDSIEKMTLTQKQLREFQSETFLTNEFLEAIIARKRQEIINMADLARKKFLVEHKRLDDDLLKIDQEHRAREVLLNAGEIENRKKEAEIQRIKNQDELNKMITLSNIRYQDAKTDAQREIVNILRSISLDEEFLKTMPPEQKTLTILTTINQAITEYKDTDVLKLLKDLVVEREQLSIEKERATLPQIIEKGEQEKVETENRKLKLARQQKRDEL